ncbi:MAG: Stage V sporulation protein e [Candidatus Magasanikbacteria bacterium GW2011_GWC2_40_17]|uniref:Probable peptidoglycan glycosyltransferase FtsW n=1 Tax=Candidatus Magasanikbacteria bacterium GW2011_GWA2_42_32 TaxID=1619039 RepID=A0A0G1A8V6_9BACT|nr:MAG: Stage V sporulation protein e [Candidatus Magasanikbacteria bacterium GW2011_GWC2_40_17]KKS57482.1 MAG: Stage V sporulation protein e [Candidatus Magasanikbacteria bacterium GW2011_GWA2_42_32]OGH85198.1 MAG: cell division protein FtsW [Candidatus Magasanikbacteria bacterium RIFOXYB2_FULL_38_10]
MLSRKSDIYFLGSLVILLFFGLLMLFSASSPESYAIFHDPYFLIKRQILLGVLPGVILFYIFSRLDFNFWQKAALPLFLFSLGLLILVLIPGVGGDFGSARSWFSIFGFSFQPSELMKLALAIYLASWLSRLSKEDFTNYTKSFFPFLAIVAVIGLLLMKQPDMGTFLVLFLISLGIYFVAGGPLLHLLILFGGGLVGFISLVFISSYRLHRLLAFLNPKEDVLGIGYHINQALLALGSGGFFGLGWGHSRQKFQYLPEVSADSIFAIIGEELGFLISVIFICLLFFIFFRGLKIAQNAPNHFGKLLTVGIMVWFIGQSCLNIGAMVGLLPLTGLPLPFVSHGGSALMILLAALGIVVNISKQMKT